MVVGDGLLTCSVNRPPLDVTVIQCLQCCLDGTVIPALQCRLDGSIASALYKSTVRFSWTTAVLFGHRIEKVI